MKFSFKNLSKYWGIIKIVEKYINCILSRVAYIYLNYGIIAGYNGIKAPSIETIGQIAKDFFNPDFTENILTQSETISCDEQNVSLFNER